MTIDPTAQLKALTERLQAATATYQQEISALQKLIADLPAQSPTGTSGSISVPDTPAPLPQIIVDLDSANVRANPTTSSVIMGRLMKDQMVTITGVVQDAEGKANDAGVIHMWYALEGGGYVRHDVVRRVGDWSAFGLSAEPVPVPPPPAPALLPLPVRGAVLTNEHHTDGAHQHLGWDLAAALGTPIVASADGFVQWMKRCVPCGEEGRSRTDAGVLTDPAWNYGYGNYLVVRYRWEALPVSLQQRYPTKMHAFVMLAHLQRFSVNEERVLVRKGQELGKLGSSGNSTGPHVHVEVRLSSLLNPLSWDAIRGGLVDPGVLFTHP